MKQNLTGKTFGESVYGKSDWLSDIFRLYERDFAEVVLQRAVS